jgi:hypothetical protein
MGSSVSTREEIVSVLKRGNWVHEKGCMRARKEAVWVLLGTQYGSQCEYKEIVSVLERGELGSMTIGCLCTKQQTVLFPVLVWQN